MTGFETTWVLAFLSVVPVLYFVYRKIIQKKKKDAIKFSNIGFIKSALGDKRK